MSIEFTWSLVGAVAGILGLLVGSFLNVCICRMPEDRSVVWPPSHCPACGTQIRPWDNIPVLSWLILRAKCRDCGSPISSLYPTIELLTGAVAWLLWRRLVPDLLAFDLAHIAAFCVYLSFAAMLIALTFIDVRHYIIPDQFSIYAVPYGIAAAALLGWLGYPDAIGWRQAVLGAFFGGGVILSISGLYWLIRRRMGMGMGDVKLLAMIGAFLGTLPALPFVLMVSCWSAAIVGVPYAVITRQGSRTSLPFGPFLAFAALIWLFHGPETMERFFPGIHMMVGTLP